MPTLAILTSGGDAPGMNTAVVSATKVAAARGWDVVGVLDGYEGLIDGRFRPLTPEVVSRWWNLGGTELGSARSERFRERAGRTQAGEHLKRAGVEALIVIGGNGSLTGGQALERDTGVRVVGVPASIDNDLACTSIAIGVDTALNTIVEACDRLSDTARSHRRAFFVEVMGRDCGYLAMASSIAAMADAVLFREQGRSEDELVHQLRGLLRDSVSRGKQRVLVIVAEGVSPGTARLAERVSEHLEQDAPGFGLRHTVLGHVVRGGKPSFRDRLVAGRLAFGAVSAAMAGESGVMVGYEPSESGGVRSADPSVHLFPIDRVLADTAALLDGTHPTTKRRLALLDAVAGVLPL